MKKLIYIFSFITLLLTSCDKNEVIVNTNDLSIPVFENNDYNNDIKNLALSVSNALKESKEFREILKSENLRKFDGDYDVLLNQIVDKPLSARNLSDLKLSKSNYYIKDLLEESFVDSISETTTLKKAKTNNSFIDELLEKYPLLQIAIPVHAETWDCETIPVVTFIPSDFEEGITKSVIGYTGNGDTVAIDALTPPNFPVIVISLNERIDEADISKIIQSGPVSPTNLTGFPSSSGILLTWNYSGLDSDQLTI